MTAETGQRHRTSLLRRTCRIEASFHPNSQACESRLPGSLSDVSMGATKQPETFFHTVPSNTCAATKGLHALIAQPEAASER